MLQTGIFPDALKIAKICPVFKSGEKTRFENYRPISVLSSFSKFFEKVIFNRLLSYLNSNDILIKNQYGFRKNHSTSMPLIEMYEKISTAIDKCEFPIGIFIDLSKAFDTLDHKILLQKLKHYGIRGVALKLFESYLSNRKQCVVLNNYTSSTKNISFGVPQGSILGPLLFILYVNDITNCSKYLHFILFADDTNLFYSCSDINVLFQTVNAELAKLAKWFRANKLSLNVEKTNYILFGGKHLPNINFTLLIDGSKIEQVDSTKFLGIIIDAKLNWKKHTNYIASKISSGLGILSRIKLVVPRNVLLMLYYTMIYPYLTYCTIVWGSANSSVLNHIVILQKRAIRLILNSHYRASSSALFYALKLLKVPDIVNFQTMHFMFKLKNNLLPLSCMNYVSVANIDRIHITRRICYFNIPSVRTNIHGKSITVRGPKDWNALPLRIQNLNGISLFKRELCAFYINSYA